ncbi:MAG: hypothetical protein QF714_08735 [Dehalococcoidia bacterium]|jgi:hypothetical protein|nr:hypothetical protein [Dehalococcoidia bacterium]MDP6227769.1 hypothetical protein [Dehalococcoidia bacterium]MDP7083750.1 hypothetical protein [Dehalococcoidia bacterium]MDP7202045.1 hypothetical protein [Dehalococcoidia bacterium]MDP7511215.1 hypothetical protein [Dehalococcoidia bacterium]
MTGEHFGFMDGGSACGMFDTMGFDQALDLGGDQLAGMFGVIDGDRRR